MGFWYAVGHLGLLFGVPIVDFARHRLERKAQAALAQAERLDTWARYGWWNGRGKRAAVKR